MKKTLLLIIAFIVPVHAQDGMVPTYSSPHDVLVATIQQGSASGIMTGEIAEHLTRTFRSQGTLFVQATVVKSLPQADCKRIAMIYTKKDVNTQKGLTEAILTLHLNYCLDGSPPQINNALQSISE